MRGLYELTELKSSENSNNFLWLRLVAASLVIYGHSPSIAAPSPAYADLFGDYFHFDHSDHIGVDIFFLISGFLVTKSFLNTQSVFVFLWKRALRILPGFLVCILLCTFVLGGIMTNMPFLKYVLDPSTKVFILNASLLYNFAAYLPNVVFTNRRYGMTVDGSLWSLFVEARLYLTVALLGGMGIFKSKIFSNLVFLAIVILTAFIPDHLPMIIYSKSAMIASAFFLLGSLIYINRLYISIDYSVLAILAFACYLSRMDEEYYEIFFVMTITYAVFVIAYAPKIPSPRFLQDYSYGIYLYGWPVQATLAHLFSQMSPIRMTIFALMISWCIGALSWFAVEKPFLRLKRGFWFGRGGWPNSDTGISGMSA